MATPVAWRVKDFADGWIFYYEKEQAEIEAGIMGGALIEPLFANPAPVITEEMVERARAVGIKAAGSQPAILGAAYGQMCVDALTAALTPKET